MVFGYCLKKHKTPMIMKKIQTSSTIEMIPIPRANPKFPPMFEKKSVHVIVGLL